MSAAADTILAKLEAGKTTTEVPAALMPLFRPSVQPYLMSWFALDPAKVLGGVNAPKLILQGETDIQVSVSDAKRLAEFSPAAKLAVIPGMNHVLKDVPDDRPQQIASYTDPTLPVDSTLVSEIVRFVETVSVGRKE